MTGGRIPMDDTESVSLHDVAEKHAEQSSGMASIEELVVRLEKETIFDEYQRECVDRILQRNDEYIWSGDHYTLAGDLS
ncbi:MAG: hypothetical protein ABEJ56_06050 [Candidatus Nanohaloarchaea archaeon]